LRKKNILKSKIKEEFDMSLQYSIYDEGVQASPYVAKDLSHQLSAFVKPLLVHLHQSLDLRLIHTFLATLHVLLQWRHRNNGLLLSELGAYLASPAHAPAGTKRVSNLLHSPNWQSSQIETYLWQRAQTRLAELEQAGEEALVLWDESVLEKPESIQLEGLCAGRSSKARRDPPHQTWLLPSTGRSSHLCTRHAVARTSCAWQKWSSHFGSDEVVDNTRRSGDRETTGGDSFAGCVPAGMGTPRAAYL
jgi:hypothetical protein